MDVDVKRLLLSVSVMVAFLLVAMFSDGFSCILV